MNQLINVQSIIFFIYSYFADKINAILKLPVDLSCINDELLAKLCKHLNSNQLNHINDRKGIFLKRIYTRKNLEYIEDKTFYKCSLCHKIYTSELKDLSCLSAQNQIDYYGNSLLFHLPLSDFNCKTYYNNLLNRGISQEKIYWKLWSLSTYLEYFLYYFFRCSYCHKTFCITDLDKCKYHPNNPVLSDVESCFRYPCCGGIYMKQDGFTTGCSYRNHTIEPSKENILILDCYNGRKNDILSVNDSNEIIDVVNETEDDDDYRPKEKTIKEYFNEFRTIYQKPIPHAYYYIYIYIQNKI